MAWRAVAFRGTPAASRARTSSARPAATIPSTRRSIRAFISSRSRKARPIYTGAYRLGAVRVSRLWAVMVLPVSRYTSRARRIRFSSAGWSLAAASGSTARSSSRRGRIPPRRSSCARAARTAPPLQPGAKERPAITASRYSPDPPTRIGSLPRARISCTHRSAASANRATDQLSSGEATATIWWGTPSISSAVGAAVPMVIPR